MKCITDKEILDFLNGEVKSNRQKKISLHLKKCENCQRRLKEWEKVFRLTEEFVKNDKDSVQVPQYKPEIHQPFFKPEIVDGERFIWLKHWWKSAAATAAAAIIVLAIIIFSSPKQQPNISQYFVWNNEYGDTEAYLFDENTLSGMEEVMLKEIYQEEEARNEILYDNWEDMIEMLSDEDIKFFENKISKAKTS